MYACAEARDTCRAAVVAGWSQFVDGGAAWLEEGHRQRVKGGKLFTQQQKNVHQPWPLAA